MNRFRALRRYERTDGLGQQMDWGAIFQAGAVATGSVAEAVGSGVAAANARRIAEERTRAIQAAVPWIAGALGLVAVALILK